MSRRARCPEEHSIFKDDSASGVVRLLVSVLHRSIRDYVQYRECPYNDPRFEFATDAWEWLMNEADDGLCSFPSICMIFGVDQGVMRRKIACLTAGEVPEEGAFINGLRYEDICSTEEEDSEGEIEE